MKNKFKEWEKEKRLIPIMIERYCKGNHSAERKMQGLNSGEICAKCNELKEYALLRLDKCPFKADKKFCSFCKIHCYKSEMRERIKAVMKYSGARMLLSRPVFALKHFVQLIEYKKSLKKRYTQMKEFTIEVEGMKCGMCESHINDAVRRACNVKKVTSSHIKNTTTVIAEDNVNKQEIVNAITSQGYSVGKISEQPYEKHRLLGRKK